MPRIEFCLIEKEIFLITTCSSKILIKLVIDSKLFLKIKIYKINAIKLKKKYSYIYHYITKHLQINFS